MRLKKDLVFSNLLKAKKIFVSKFYLLSKPARFATVSTLAFVFMWGATSASFTGNIEEARDHFSKLSVITEINNSSIEIETLNESPIQKLKINTNYLKIVQTEEYDELEIDDLAVGDQIIVQGLTDGEYYFAKRIISFTTEIEIDEMLEVATTTDDILNASSTASTTVDLENSSSTNATSTDETEGGDSSESGSGGGNDSSETENASTTPETETSTSTEDVNETETATSTSETSNATSTEETTETESGNTEDTVEENIIEGGEVEQNNESEESDNNESVDESEVETIEEDSITE